MEEQVSQNCMHVEGGCVMSEMVNLAFIVRFSPPAWMMMKQDDMHATLKTKKKLFPPVISRDTLVVHTKDLHQNGSASNGRPDAVVRI